MGDSTIHDLPAAVSVNDTDVLPLDQGLVTVGATVAQIAAKAASINLGPAIHVAPAKATPVDADELGIWDSVTGVLNKLTWANLKTTLNTSLMFLQSGTGAVSRTMQSKLRDTISVKDFGAVGDGITNDTAAVQAAINAFSTTGATLLLPGNFLIGAITFPTNIPYRLEVDGGIILTTGTTLSIPPGVTIYGKSGSLEAQFSSQSPGCLITGSETSDPVVSITGSQGKCLENVVIASPKFRGLYISGVTTLNALCKLKNVSCTARPSVATSKPFVADNTFWLDMEDCTFMAMNGSADYSMEFLQSVGIGSYDGLITGKNIRVNARGIYIESASAIHSTDFNFENLQIENCDSGASLVTINNEDSNFISRISLKRPQLFDSVGTAYLFNNIGNSLVSRLDVFDFDYNQAILFNPSSTRLGGFSIAGNRPYPFTSAISGVPENIYLFDRKYNGALDTILTTANRTPSNLPVTPFAVEQDPATWSALASGGATVTTGIADPYGGTGAGQIGGTNGGLITLYNIATVVALNDWFICGYWAQSAESGKMPTNARLDLAGGGWNVNETAVTTVELGSGYEPFAVSDQSWKWVCEPVKVTTTGTGLPFVRLYLRRDTTYGITNYFMPGILHIPASLGIPDAEIIALSRSLQAWNSSGFKGDLCLLPNQMLRIGGGVGYFSAAAEPTAGTWHVGEIIKNSVPSVGQPKGWVTTVSGTAGTLNSGATTGDITTATKDLVVNSATELTVGVYITIAGVTGIKLVTAISGTAVTIDVAADATVTGAAIAYSNPTFVSEGNL